MKRTLSGAGASRAAAAAVVALALLAASGCASYGKLERYREAYPDAAAFFESRGVPSFGASEPALYMDGGAWYERAMELIAGAEDYILISSFLITDIDRQEAIFDALAERMADGVRVYMIVDSASYYRTYPMDAEPIPASTPLARALGIPLIEYNPIRGRRIFTLLGLLDRDHRKFWVVDGRTVVTGGQNVDYDSLRDVGSGGCVDAMIEYDSPGAAAFLRDSFVRTWNAYSLDRLDPGDFAAEGDRGEYRISIVDQGLRSPGLVTGMFDGFAAFASEELWLVQCYAYLTPSLLDKVRFAVDRGVRVKVVLSREHVTARALYGSYYGMLDLIDAGASVYLYESDVGSLLHFKLILADGKLASVGSANYNLRSQTTSRELSFVVSDPESLAMIRSELDALLASCRPVRREEARRYRGLPYLMQNLLMQFWG